MILEVKNLTVKVEDKPVVKQVSLSIDRGEVHSLMGPNGSGKSSLAFALTGHPRYKVTEGSVIFKGKNLLEMKPDERAKAGIFLAFQSPVAVPGLTVFNFLRESYQTLKGEEISDKIFKRKLDKLLAEVSLAQEFSDRYINEGFSGGEQKKMEVLQVLLLKPTLAILDEVDSGLDVDSLRTVISSIVELSEKEEVSFLIISHDPSILERVSSDTIHIMKKGRVVKRGDQGIASNVKEEGFEKL